MVFITTILKFRIFSRLQVIILKSYPSEIWGRFPRYDLIIKVRLWFINLTWFPKSYPKIWKIIPQGYDFPGYDFVRVWYYLNLDGLRVCPSHFQNDNDRNYTPLIIIPPILNSDLTPNHFQNDPERNHTPLMIRPLIIK